jgi:hypothetical protein
MFPVDEPDTVSGVVEEVESGVMRPFIPMSHSSDSSCLQDDEAHDESGERFSSKSQTTIDCSKWMTNVRHNESGESASTRGAEQLHDDVK